MKIIKLLHNSCLKHNDSSLVLNKNKRQKLILSYLFDLSEELIDLAHFESPISYEEGIYLKFAIFTAWCVNLVSRIILGYLPIWLFD